MAIKPDGLADALKRGLKPLYAMIGDEPLLALECADQIRAAARAQGFTERSTFTVDTYFKWGELAQATASMGLFGDKKIIEVRMPTGKPGRDGGDALSAWCASLDHNTAALITLPKPDGASRKTAWFGALETHALTVACDALPRGEIGRWVATRMRRNQQTTGDDALAFMAERFEGNLIGARQEIEKLAMLFPAGKIELAQIQAVVADVARYDVFQLGEAVLHADTARVLRMLDGLQAEGESPVRVHHTLQQDLRQLLVVLEATSNGKPLPLALREAGVWGPRQFLFERIAPRLSLSALKPLLAEAAAVDLICKGIAQNGLPREPWAALRHLALGLIGAAQSAKGDKGAQRLALSA